MLALSIPMSVLVATLMAFGRMGSDFEIVAIKASGIHMMHVITPMLIAAGLLTFGMIEFHDKVLPDLNKKARMLLGDIQAMRPTLIFESGIFISDVPGYLILIDKVDHTTSHIEGIRINETKDPQHPRLIIAEDGYLEVTDEGRNMRFSLNNGELHTLDMSDPDNYRRLEFEHQVINVSGNSSELVRSESEYRTDREMEIKQMEEQVKQAVYATNPLRGKIQNTIDKKFEQLLMGERHKFAGEDTLRYKSLLNMVKQDASALVRLIQRNATQIAAQKRIMDKYNIEIQKKYSIPAASLAFILIGAPLGIMTRKGGMGVAIAISILLFIVYWAFLIGGEDVADRGIVSPFWAMWSANILIGSIGLYLIYIVVSEKPIFSWFRKIK